MTPALNQEAMDRFCQLFIEAMKVNPEARAVLTSMVDTLMEHQVPQDGWGTILFCVWQALQDEASQGSGAYHDGSGP